MKQEAGNYIWNSIGGMLNAAQSVFVLMVISRVLGLEAAGVFSIAFATGNLFLYLGNYGVRNYQVSDVEELCSVRIYVRHRILTVFLMLAASAAYCAYGYAVLGYSADKTATVFAMCILKAVDCVEEVFEGRLHQRGRLDLAGKLMTIRLIVSIGGMIAVLLVTGSLLASTAAAIVLAVLAVCCMLLHYRGFIGWKEGTQRGSVRSLMVSCFPVCAANFLSFYLINAPKYAIDAAMSESVQAQYNFIAMPVFVIQLLNMFLYQPVLGKMTIAWNHRDGKTFVSAVVKILAGLVLTAAICLAGAYLLGIPVLSALYATDLSALKAELLLILIGGAFLALDGFLCAVLTIARRQNHIPLVYLAGMALSLLLTGRMVRTSGITGAVTAFVIVMAAVAAGLSVMLAAALRRHFN